MVNSALSLPEFDLPFPRSNHFDQFQETTVHTQACISMCENTFNGSVLHIATEIHNNVIFSKKIEEFLGSYIIPLYPEIMLVIIN